MKYLVGYSEEMVKQVHALVQQNRLGEVLLQKYSATHDIRSDKALFSFVIELKSQYLRNAPVPSKVLFDNDIRLVRRALGTHTAISRIQGGKLKAKNEIRIASLFKDVPLAFLRMITVHELAHLKEKDHNKAFYNLCLSMEPAYHQIELDVRLYLTYMDNFGALDWQAARA